MSDTEFLSAFGEWMEQQLPSLRMPPAGFMRHPYLTLGHGHYGEGGRIFFWDVFFGSLRAWHSPGYEDVILGTLQCYLDHTNPETGQVYRVTSPQGPMVISSIEQIQPLLAQFAYVANLASPIAGQQERDRILALLESYLDFWHRERNSTYGLYRWIDSYEAGLDHSPALGSFLPLTVVAPELNSYCILDLRAAASLAEQWGDSKRASRFSGRAEELAENMRKHLWSEEHGTYCHLDTTSGQRIFRPLGEEGPMGDIILNPWTNFVPLYARVATPEQARRMIEQYLLDREEFRSDFGLRSFTARSVFYTEQRVCLPTNISFMPLQRTGSNWSGAVWALTNYVLCHGMANYGYVEEAKLIALDLARMLWNAIRKDGGMAECYNPRTGESLWAMDLFGWNSLADKLWHELDSGRFALAGLMKRQS